MAGRDLKPANLMLGGSYMETDMQRKILIHELGVVKLADFGEWQEAQVGGSGHLSWATP